MGFNVTLARYQSHLLAKGIRRGKVDGVLRHIAANPEKWRRRVAKWTQRDASYEWKVVARECVQWLAHEGFPRTTNMWVSVRSLMLLGLHADAAFHVMCAIWKHCNGDDDYMYHYGPWHWLEMYVEQPVDGPGIFGAELHARLNQK